MTVSLATGMGYSLGSRNQATVNVQDNDVGISVFGPNAVEEDSASDITFTVTLSRAAPKPVTVDLTTVDGTATSDAVVTATSLGRDFVARSRTLTFEAGQIQKTFSVDLVDDTFDEPREEFTVKLSNPSDNAHVLIPTATGAILDDDEQLMVGVYRTNTRVAEDRESPVDLLLELRPAADSGTTASEHEVRVDWSLERGTAIPGADYVDDSGTATIPAGATTGTVGVTLVDDGYLEELLETFSFRIDRAVAAEVDDDNGSVEISIRDDDDILAEVTAATESIAEGSDAEFTVTLSGESTAPVTVTYAVSGTAGDSDYTAPSGTVTVPAASTEATISITTLTDEVDDADETLIVTLTAAESHGRPLQVSDTAAEATILDQGTLTVSIAGGSGAEGENASFTLSMSAPPGFWVRVNYETVDSEGDVVGEATSGTDFEATDRWWQLTNESPTKTFSIQTIEDNLVEGNETFRVRIVEAKVLSLSGDGPPIDIATHTAVLTIIDDDEPPTTVMLTVTPDSVSETAGGTPLSVTATIQGDSRLVDQLPVALDVADGTATEGEDYTAVPVMLYIPAGQAAATGPVVLFPVDDAVAGGDVTVQVTGSAQGVAVTPAAVTITDDETLPTGVALTVSPGEVREDAGPTGLEVTATLTGGDPRAVDTQVSLVVETSGSSGAVPGVDFTAGQVTLTIPAGETTAAAALTLTPTDDVVAEGDETAQVSGTSDGLVVSPAQLTIVDDDREPTGIELSVTPSEVAEDAGATDLTVTATLVDGDARGADTDVALSVSGVTATETDDFTAQAGVTLTIPAGQMSHTATLTLTPVDDTIRESAEQVAVRGDSASAGLPVSGVRVTITDDDADATAITLSVDRDTIPEDGGAQQLTVTGSLDGDTRSVDTRVTLTISGQTATESDYTALPATLLIRAGQQEGTATVVLDPTDDDIDEPDETLEVSGQARSVSTRQGGSQQSATQPPLAVSGVQVTITDDDTAGVTVTPTTFTVLEGSSSNYTVVLDTQPTADVTVSVSLPNGSDLSVSTTSLTFTASNWNVAQTVTVTAAEDDDLADDGTVTIGHPVTSTDSLYAAVTPDSVTVTVNDDDDTVSVNFGSATYTVEESDDSSTIETRENEVTVTVTLSADPEREVVIPLSAAGQDNASTDDYSGVPASITFASGETSASFTFAATADEVDDDGESVKLSFGTLPDGVTAGTTDESVVSITDDDVPSVTVSFGAATYTVEESDDSSTIETRENEVTVTVTLSADPEREVVIPLSAAGQDNASTDDYSGVPASITFASGETSASFTFAATADEVDDDGESVKLSFGTLPDGVTAGTTDESVVSITDDDVPSVTVSFGAATYTVEESDDSSTIETRENEVTVTVTLSADPEREVVIPLSAAGQDNASTDDYSGVPESVTFAIGDTEKSFTFAAAADDLDDDGESVKLAFGTLPDGVTAGSTAEAVVSITDDDVPAGTVTLVQTPATIDESGTNNVSTVTATLSTASSAVTTITVSVPEDSPVTLSENRTLTIAQGSTTSAGAVTITAVDDAVYTGDREVDVSGASSNAVGVTEPDDVTLTITDDEVLPVNVNFSSATYTVAESDDSSTIETRENEVTVTVTLSADPEREVVIPLSAAGQDNASTDDYSGVPASITFASGETSASFTFAATADEVDDDGESVKLAFGTLPTGVTAGSTAETVVTITDDDVPDVTVSFGSATYTVEESDDSSTIETRENEVTVTVTLSADPEREVVIPLSAAGQDNASTDDYSGVPESVTFAIGDTEKSFTFTATADEVDDDGESVKLSFGTLPDGVTAGTTDESVVTITDDDVPDVTVSFGAATYTVEESDDSSTIETRENEVTVTVTLSADPEREVVIPLTAAGQDNASTDDYSGVPESVTFASGDTEKSFTFSATADDLDDDGESVKLSFGTLPGGVTAGTTDESVVSITDDDVPAGTVTLVLTPATVDESGTNNVSTVTATLASASSAVTTITVSVPQDSPVTLSTNMTLTIAQGATTSAGAVTITAVDDDAYTGDREVDVSGASSNDVGVTEPDDATLTIADDEVRPVTVNFGSATYTAAEGSSVEVKVTLSADPEREVVIPLTAAGQDNASTDDYSGVPESVTFASGDTEKSFAFAATADEVDDDGEGVRLAFGTLPDGVTAGSTAEAVVSITDDDVPAGTVTLVQTPATIDESGTNNVSTVTATLSTASSAVTTITVSVPEDSPVTLSENRTLTIAQGSTTSAGAVTITAVDDAVYTGDREVDVSGASSNAVGVTEPDDVTLTITDDEVLPVNVNFSSATYTVAESDDSSTIETRENEVTVTVTLSADPEREVVIPLSAAGQDNASTDDYSGVPESVTFPSGDTEKSFTFTATADEVDDDGESVKLAFGTLPDGVTAGSTAEAVVTITDDDVPAVTVSFSSATYTVEESDDSSTIETRENEVTVKVTLSADPERSVTVPLTATSQDGASSADYSGVPESVTFASGDTEKSFTVAATGDEVDDDGESVKLAFGTLPAGVTAGTTDESVVSITDDDVPAGTVTLVQTPATIDESGTNNVSTVTATLSTASSAVTTITVSVPEDSPVTLSENRTLTIAQGSTTSAGAVTITAVDDAVYTGDREVDVSGASSNAVGVTEPDDVTLTITDDEVLPVNVNFSSATYTVAESDDSSTIETRENEVTVTVTLSADPEREVVIPLSAAGQDNASTDDYSGVPESVTFASGDTEKSFTFTATADEVDDDGESVKLTFGTLPDGVTAGSTYEAVVSITDDDVPDVTVSFGAATYTVEESDDSSTIETRENEVTITVTLSADPEREVVIPLSAAGQDNASTDDYSGVPASITFASGETSASFTFTATADEVDDDGESVKLSFGTLPDGVTAGTTDESVVSITDDDVPSVTVSFGAATYTVEESDDSSTIETRENEVTVTVTLSADPEREVVIPLTAAGQDNASTDDYSGVPESVTFPSGDTEKSFTFAATADEVDDDGEGVKLSFGTLPDGVTAGSTAEAVVSITDDDVPSVTASFGAATYTAAEGSSVEVTVTLSADPERSVTVPLTSTNQGGASSADYSGVPESVTFASGDTEKTFTFAATADEVDDDGEGVKLSFGTLPTGVTAGTTDESVVSITDDDVPSVTASFGAATYTAAEGSSVEVKVTLSADPERSVTVPLTATNQDGASSTDYSGVPASVTFASGDTEKSFTFAATADDVDDDGESVRLGFGTLPDGVTAGSTSTTTVSILQAGAADESDPNIQVLFSSASYEATEGGADAQVTVLLNSSPQSTVDIPLTAAGTNGATEGDWSGVPASLTFNAGDTSKTFAVIATDDEVDDDGESVKLAFGTLPDGVTAGTPDESVVTITDDDVPAGTVTLVLTPATVDESGTNNVSTVTATLASASSTVTTITVSVPGGSPVTLSSNRTLTIAHGATTSTGVVTITAVDDAVYTGDREVDVSGASSNDVGVTDPDDETLTITDDEVLPVNVNFSSATYTAAEGSSVEVKVTLSADPERTVTVPLTATNQDGASSADYSGVPASVTFASGDTEKSFTFSATADDLDDDGESVKLSFGTLSDGVTAGSTAEAVVSITDDDVPSVTASFGAATYTAAEGSSVEVKVTLSADPERSVTVPLTSTNQDGASSADYSGVPESVTFASGDTEKSFTFSATADDLDDDGESVKLSFGTLPGGVTAGTTDESVVSITDDDVPAGTVTLVLTPATIDESGTNNVSTVTATVATASSAVTTITVSVPQDSPVTLSTNMTLTIAQGATTSAGAVTITAVDDDAYTGDREVDVSGASSNNVGVTDPDDMTLTITDDEPEVTVSFGSATYTVAESDDSNTGTKENEVTVTVTLSADPERTVTIPITKADQGGASSADYSGVPENVVFNAGDTETSFTFTATADDLDDDNESVKLTFGTLPTGVSEGITKETEVSITDDDGESTEKPLNNPPGEGVVDESDPNIQVLFSSASYEATEGGANAQVTVLLNSSPQSTVDIPLTAAGANGATEDDWSGVPASLTFNAGDTSKTFTVIATDDDVEDDNEMVNLGFGTLPNGFETGIPGTATITLMNDDTEGTSDNDCSDAVWCAEVTFGERTSRWVSSTNSYTSHNLAWHYKGDDRYPGSSLSDATFTYRGRVHSLVSISVSIPHVDSTSCDSSLRLSFLEPIHDLTELTLHVEGLELPMTAERIRNASANWLAFFHPSFNPYRKGSTVQLRIEESESAGSDGAEAQETALSEPRCVIVHPFPFATPQNGLVGLEVLWREPSFDGAPDIVIGQADVDSYKVQWKEVTDSWDNPNAVSEEIVPNDWNHVWYHVILGLTEGVEYSVRVVATNELGDSPPSVEATGMPREVIKPKLSTATVNGHTVKLEYSELLDQDSVPANDSFEVTSANTKREVTGVVVEGNAVILTLDEAVGSSDEVELTYFRAWYIEEHSIRDLAGNFAKGLGGQSVINNTLVANQARSAKEVTPLTVELLDASGSHNGEDAFTFQVLFSESIATSETIVRDKAFEVTGGTVTQASRVDGRSDLWEITVEPHSNADVAITLLSDRACDTEGAICTSDERRLSNGIALLVLGPEVQQDPAPNTPATGAPSITGTPRVGETLTVDTTGISDQDGLEEATIRYQWIAGGNDIAGSNGSSYTIAAEDEGLSIKVQVSFTDDAGNPEVLESLHTAVVVAHDDNDQDGDGQDDQDDEDQGGDDQDGDGQDDQDDEDQGGDDQGGDGQDDQDQGGDDQDGDGQDDQDDEDQGGNGLATLSLYATATSINEGETLRVRVVRSGPSNIQIDSGLQCYDSSTGEYTNAAVRMPAGVTSKVITATYAVDDGNTSSNRTITCEFRSVYDGVEHNIGSPAIVIVAVKE